MAFDGLLSVVIPVYRSEKYLARTVGELVEYLEQHVAFEIILVNDGSPDGVQRVVDALGQQDGRIAGVELRRNLGQHRATLVGFAHSRGDVVVTVDDDGQNPPSAAMAVAEMLVAHDLDAVYGKFSSVRQSLSRRIASAVNQAVSQRTIQNRAGIAISNVRALRGDLARAISAVPSPYPYVDALIFRMTSHVGSVQVEHRLRAGGASNYTLGKLVRLWVSHLTSLSMLPLKIAMIGSFGVAALGLAVGLVGLIRALAARQAPPGWLSLFCAVMFLFSTLFVFLGIISAYVGRTYVTLSERGLTWTRNAQPATAKSEAQQVQAARRES